MHPRILVTLLWALFAAFAQGDAGARAEDPVRRPNIVHIVADDLGWKDVGFHGSDIRTPNLDALAAAGLRLERFYAQPMCTPTRACLMTGRYPFRYGLQTAVIPSAHTYGLPTDEWLLPQALKEAGYATAMVGKWHLGHADRKYWPVRRGFDSHYGPLIGELDYFTHRQHGITDWFRGEERVEEPGYTTTLLGDEAVRVVERHDAAKPLYLYLAFNAPHAPYQAPPEAVERYREIADPTRRTYAAMVTAMDEQIGRVVAALDAKGLRSNTLIVFHSDNGGVSDPMFSGEGDVSKIRIPCDNGPYRDGKGSLYEGGTRVAALAHWPGRIAPGTSDALIHVVDLFPTYAGLAGASTAKCKPLDGLDVWPAIAQGAASPRTELVYNVETFRAAVRQGDWKLVWRARLPAQVELFDLSKDPSEKEDRSAAEPERVAALQRRVQELAEQMAPSLVLSTEFAAIRDRLKAPPVFPADLGPSAPPPPLDERVFEER